MSSLTSSVWTVLLLACLAARSPLPFLVDDPEDVDARPAEIDLVELAPLLCLDVVQEQQQCVEQVVPAGGQLQLATALAIADLNLKRETSYSKSSK